MGGGLRSSAIIVSSPRSHTIANVGTLAWASTSARLSWLPLLVAFVAKDFASSLFITLESGCKVLFALDTQDNMP